MDTNQEIKTANQLYKESGSSLSFTEWLQQEKDKSNTFIKNQKLNELIQNATDKLKGVSKETNSSSNKFFGLSKNVIIISSIIIISAISFKIYKNFKK